MLIKGGMGQRGCSQIGTNGANGEKWPKWNFQANGVRMG